MGEKFDGDQGLGLGLSLSLGGQNQPSLKLNLAPFPSSFVQNDHRNPHRPFSGDLFHSDKSCNSRSSFQRGVIDMNRTPVLVDAADAGDDQGGVSSPNSTISSASAGGKRGEMHLQGTEAERTSSSRGGSDDEDGGAGDGDASRKKLRLSKEQSIVLEETFKEHNTLNPKQKVVLAQQLNLRPRQVEVWFQNRRARTKLKQTEVDCEYLKRCCENLTQENRRLQKEVQELRALKLSPHLYTQMAPPTTLTMCPSCERVAVSGAGSGGTQNRQLPSFYPKRPIAVKASPPVASNRS